MCKRIHLLVYALIALGVVSCSDETTAVLPHDVKVPRALTELNKEQAKERFATILSKAVYQHKEVRDFLKSEALQQFDENYDVLYAVARDKQVGKKSFRQLLVESSSEGEVAAIEQKLPLLNILLPSITCEEMNPENFDTKSSEVPVAVAGDSVSTLFMNGEHAGEVPKGAVPGFPLFVVNENSRVEAPAQSVRGISEQEVVFKSPNYDRKRRLSTRATVAEDVVGHKAIEAFRYFYKDDGSDEQKGYQRDYVYFGMTPTNRKGSLNRSVTEYLTGLEISPKAFGLISDYDEKKGADPHIKQGEVGKWGGPGHSYEKLITIMWTEGSFNFRIEVTRGNSSTPFVFYLPLKPQDIWNFNLIHYRKHGTWFRQEHNIWWIDVDKFTSKVVALNGFDCSFPKWVLAEEGAMRYVSIFEEDPSEEKEYTEEHEVIRVGEGVFKSGVKVKFGTAESELSSSLSSSTTQRDKIVTKVVRKLGSDLMGTIPVYFYDPIIERKEGNNYVLHTYSSGVVKFSLVSK